MEWLRKILESIKIEENKIDVDEILKSVNTEFPKYAVPKETFNKANEQLKEANKAIESFNSKMTQEDLEKIKTEHQAQIKKIEENHKIEVEKMQNESLKTRKLSAVEKTLLTNKAKHVDLLTNKFDLEKITVGEDGKVAGIEEQLKTLQESYKDLFETSTTETTKQTNAQSFYKYVPGGSGEASSEITAEQIKAAVKGQI
ncbi:phage scaffolding protein [Clostridioides sp. ZZV14-6009]|uniref:phage scaffolding protein n=1 Tax=unclassified Clostridioides TaxID=2635829 RepID=UPI001D101FFF|nr:phage scaffolding protein [Clostridioides sp. ZZV15-6388]MCC0736161.1 phage scaffolding protein [Clostridioides sp. ZZV14-6009]